MTITKDFYTSFAEADEVEDMKAICKLFGKSYKVANQALVAATKIHMASSSNSKEEYHKLIIEWLKKKGL